MGIGGISCGPYIQEKAYGGGEGQREWVWKGKQEKPEVQHASRFWNQAPTLTGQVTFSFSRLGFLLYKGVHSIADLDHFLQRLKEVIH